MIKLINGRGQLGEKLNILLKDEFYEKDIYLYHTWNPWQKDHNTQEREYKKFVGFVEQHKNNKIILISTYSQNENHYVHFKQVAEAYLITQCSDCLVIRLPNLIGNKGILKRLKNQTAGPQGKIEFMTIEDAAMEIINLIKYNGLLKVISLKGEEISARLVNEILQKGAKIEDA